MKKPLLLLSIVITILASVTAMAQTPPNDSCVNARLINLNKIDEPFIFTMSGANPDTVTACGGVTSTYSGVWFTFTGTGLAYRFSICASPNVDNSNIRIYSGSCGALTCVAGNQGGCFFGYRSEIALVHTQPGVQYYVLISHPTGIFFGFTSNLKVTEHTVSGIVGPDQNACYGGKPYPITLSSYTGSVVKWQYRNVQFGTNIDTNQVFYHAWNDISGSAGQTSYTPETVYSGKEYRAIIDNGNGWYPIANTGVVYVLTPFISFPSTGSCDCNIENTASSWSVDFRNNEISTQIMFRMYNTGSSGVHLGETRARSFVHTPILVSGNYKFLSRGISLMPKNLGDTVTIQFAFRQSEYDSLKASDPAYTGKTPYDLKVMRYNGEVTTPYGIGEVIPSSFIPTFSGGYPGLYAISFTTHRFGTFFLTFDEVGSEPLPITLGSFTAECKNGNRVLNWTTLSEVNNNFFTIHKSIDLQNWEEVRKISGAGNSNELLSYEYVDSGLMFGRVYYRLTQTDYNGDLEVFTGNIVSVECATETQAPFVIYPNPSDGNFTVTCTIDDGKNFAIKVTDLYGKHILSKTFVGSGVTQTLPFSIPTTPSVYVLTIISEGRAVYSQKLVVY